MENDTIYPGMMLRNCQGDIGWVVGENPDSDLFERKFPYFVEWIHNSESIIYVTTAQKILDDHQNFLDLERQHGL